MLFWRAPLFKFLQLYTAHARPFLPCPSSLSLLSRPASFAQRCDFQSRSTLFVLLFADVRNCDLNLIYRSKPSLQDECCIRKRPTPGRTYTVHPATSLLTVAYRHLRRNMSLQRVKDPGDVDPSLHRYSSRPRQMAPSLPSE